MSSISSLSSVVSVRSEIFTEVVSNIEAGGAAISAKIDVSRSLIQHLAESEKGLFVFGSFELNLQKVLDAVLSYSDSCGGSHSTNYTASSILACVVGGEHNTEGTLDMLRDLAITWVSYLLFAFKNNYHPAPWSEQSSGIATPAFFEDGSTSLHHGVPARVRKGVFRDQIREHDGYRCVVTQLVDYEHPVYKHQAGFETWFLRGCHIIPRTIVVFDSERDSDAYHSAMTTFDILRHYTQLSVKTPDELEDLVHHPSNGFLLEMNAHNGFAKFHWCLQLTEVKHKYKAKVYSKPHGLRMVDRDKEIEFKDHSSKFQLDNSLGSSSKPLSISLPDPRYIAIHAGIAGVLHTSGAGKFLDELLEKFDGGDRSLPIRSWEELERAVKLDCIEKMLPSVMV